MVNNKGVTVRIYDDKIKDIKMKALDCLYLTAEALHTDLVQSQTMPFKTGTLQNESTYVQKKIEGDGVQIHTNTPYARRLYYHPEYNFSKVENPNAGAYWYETYVSGDKKEFVKETFKKMFEGR